MVLARDIDTIVPGAITQAGLMTRPENEPGRKAQQTTPAAPGTDIAERDEMET